MRQIKFRKWDKKDKLWLTGWHIGISGDYSEAGDLVLMQFTGLLDKNGKEIYEGDIVEYQYLNTLDQEIRRSEVKLLSLGDVNKNLDAYYPFCYCVGGSYKDRSREVVDVFLTPANDCEIIGNIYESPELLTN